MEEKPTLIMVEVLPLKNGKRNVIVSAAPAGEMPVARKGAFAAVHTLINEVWAELLKRKPQVPRGTLTAKGTEEDDPEPPAAAVEPATQAQPAGDAPGLPAHLPEIEGDQLVASTPAPALSSLDEETHSEANHG
jgi:hypothetical protein